MAWTVVAEVAKGLFDGFGAAAATDRQNKNNEKQVERQDKYNKEQFDYQWGDDGQVWRKYDFDKETVDIQRENQDKQIALAENQAYDQWSYGMTIRDFEYNERIKVRDQQMKQAGQQVQLNEQAYDLGQRKQDVWLNEQEIGLDFEEMGLDIGWANNQTNFQLNQSMIDSDQRGKRAQNMLQMQAASVAGLKAQGQARARGQSGRSAGKSVQAAIAENGAKQAVISEMTTQAGDQYAYTTQKNVNTLDQAYKELFMNKQKLDNSRISLGNADMFMREEMKQQFEQANLAALSKVMITPTLAPDLPIPPDLDLYKGVFQEPFEPEAPPEVPKGIAQTSSVFGSFLGAAGGSFGKAIGGLGGMSVPKPNIDYGGGGYGGGGNGAFTPGGSMGWTSW